MNREHAKQFLKNSKFIQAFAEGKTVQSKNASGQWLDSDYPDFTCEPESFRIVDKKLRPYNEEEACRIVGSRFRHKDGGVHILDGYDGKFFRIRSGLFSPCEFLIKFAHYPSGDLCGVVE